MSIDWFRWYHGSINDPKFTVIARKSKQPRSLVIATWAAVLEHASQAEERGSITNLETDSIAACLDVEEEAIDAILSAMKDKGLLDDARVSSWGKRQVMREDDSRDRVRKFRERQRTNDEKRDVTHGNAEVTPKIREDKIREDKTIEIPSSTPLRVVGRAQERARAHEGGDDRSLKKAPIPPDWQPSESALAILAGCGIYYDFAMSCIPEFILYWTERGERRAGWDASFVNSVRRSWEKYGKNHKVLGRRRPGQTIAERITEEHELLYGNEPDPFCFLPQPAESSRLIEGEVEHVH